MAIYVHYRGRGRKALGITRQDLNEIIRNHIIIDDLKAIAVYNPSFMDKRVGDTKIISKKHYIEIQTNTRGNGQDLAFWEKRIVNGRIYYKYVGDDLSKINA